MGEDLRSVVENALSLSEEELKSSLSFLMDTIKGVGLKEFLRVVPDLLSRMMEKMETLELASFVREVPEASSKFLEVLWEGLGLLAEGDPEIKGKLMGMEPLTVNFRATDSPMAGHFRVSGGRLSGGGRPLMNADLVVEASTADLVGLLTGKVDPVWGALQGRYRVEGKVADAMRLAPLMKLLPRLLTGRKGL
ncbi:MAG: SCP2 sterol-binding domain-containing protein [Hadesarchaea archaeon]|nr:SCP2 sterol-binding domain-containing protein [Hadesarchaea archaeon]